ncbi:LOW QUALITY PROTEIN: hypothetical protein KUTeg_022900 [Tegillarca granosa]|uniref:Sulfotransferase domain-containing protein n=1 Tax=Tegillarca granosa TaxID=220873 RepID=A0ABQ9E5W6_TEGGR|nr:LOW QUALITY PROTEIN: hypothetical protein KUTeg_022900 [Tegillarca granosa]
MMRKGKAEYEPIRKESAMLELHTPEEFDRMTSPRTLNTHLLFRQIQDDIKRRKNPKDIAVSLFHHTKSFFTEDKSTWEDTLETFSQRYPIGEIKKLAEYLEIELDDRLISEIADKCRFNNMKIADNDKSDMGEVGDWKNWFTVAQSERFDAEYKDKMKNSKLNFIFEHK